MAVNANSNEYQVRLNNKELYDTYYNYAIKEAWNTKLDGIDDKDVIKTMVRDKAIQQEVAQLAENIMTKRVAPFQANKAHAVSVAADAVLFRALGRKSEITDGAQYKISRQATLDMYTNFGAQVYDVMAGYTAKMRKNLYEGYSAAQSVLVNYSPYMGKEAVTPNMLRQGIKNIKNKGAAAVFDFETLGGKNTVGQQVLDSITEFTFQIHDVNTQTKHTYGTAIGITAEQSSEYLNIIENVGEGKGFRSDREKVIYDRLKLYGSNSTVLDAANSDFDRGIFRFKSFASKEEAMAGGTKEALAGLKLLTEFGSFQEKSKTVYKGYEMHAWEAELFGALDEIRSRDLTLVGHNIAKFDIPMLRIFLSNGLRSAGAQAYMEANYGKGWTAQHIMDTMVLERTADKKVGSLTEENIRVMKQFGLTSNQQEYLMRAYVNPHFYDDAAAHLAEKDVEANAILALYSGRYGIGKKGASILSNKYGIEKDIKIKGDGSQLFVNRSGRSLMSYNLYTIQESSFENVYHTADGAILYRNGTNAVEGGYGIKNLQRSGTYTVTGIRKFTPKEDLRKALGGINQRLGSGELYSITLEMESRSKKTNKALSKIHVVGTLDDIRQYMQDNMDLVATREIDQTAGRGAGRTYTYKTGWTTQGISEDVLDRNRMGYIEGGAVNISSATDVNRLIEYSDMITENDSAARTRRDFSLPRDRNLLNFIDYVDAEAAKIVGSVPEVAPPPAASYSKLLDMAVRGGSPEQLTKEFDNKITEIVGSDVTQEKFDQAVAQIKQGLADEFYFRDENISSFIDAFKAETEKIEGNLSTDQRIWAVRNAKKIAISESSETPRYLDDFLASRDVRHAFDKGLSAEEIIEVMEEERVRQFQELQGVDGIFDFSAYEGNATQRARDSYERRMNVARAKVRDNILEASRKLAELEGKDPERFRNLSEEQAKNVYRGTLQGMFGWYSEKDGRERWFASTIDNAMQSEQFVRDNFDVYKTAMQEAEKVATHAATRNAAYTQIMKGLIDGARVNDSAVAGAIQNIPVPKYRIDQFEINLAGMGNIGRNEKAIIGVDIRKGATGFGIAEKAYKLLNPSVRQMKEHNIIATIGMLQQHLLKTGQGFLEEDGAGVITAKDTEESAGKKIIDMLRLARARDSKSGFLTDTDTYFVIGGSHLRKKNFGYTAESLSQTVHNLASNLIEFADPMPINTAKDRATFETNTRRRMEKFVKSVLFNRQDLLDTSIQTVQAFAKEQGVSLKVARNLLHAREQRFSDMVDFMTDIAVQTRYAGGNFGYSLEKGKFYITEANGNITEIQNLAKDIYADSLNYTKIKNQKVANPLGYYILQGRNRDDVLTFSSRTRLAHDSVSWMRFSLKDAALTGTGIGNAAQSVVNKFNSVLAEASSERIGDAQDVKAVGQVDLRGIVKMLGKMDAAGVLSDFHISEERKAELEKLDPSIRRKQADYSKYIIDKYFLSKFKEGNTDVNMDLVSYSIDTALANESEAIFAAADRYIGMELADGNPAYRKVTKADKDIIEGISFSTKSMSHGKATFNKNDDYGDSLSSGKRGIAEQYARAMRYNMDNVQNANLEDISFGRGIRTKERDIEVHRNTGLGYETDDTIRVRRLAGTTSDIRALVNDVIANNGEFELKGKTVRLNENTLKLLSTINTHENTAVISPDILDNVFTQRAFEQQIQASNIVVNPRNLEDFGVPEYDLENGEVHIGFSQGRVIRQGERAIPIKGYMEAIDHAIAKYDAFAEWDIVNSRGESANREEVQRLLSENTAIIEAIDESRKLQGAEKFNKIQQVHELVSRIYEENGLSMVLRMRAIDAQAHLKVAEMGREKNMARVLASTIGSVDSRVGTVFETLLGKGSEDILDDRGRIVGRRGFDAIRDLVLEADIFRKSKGASSLSDTLFGRVMSAYSMNGNLAESDFSRALKAGGFTSFDEFASAFFRERKAAFEGLNQILKSRGFIEEGQVINFISDSLNQEVKGGHQDYGIAVDRLIMNMEDAGMSRNEIVKELTGIVSNIKVDDTGRIIATEERLNMTKFGEVMKRFYGANSPDIEFYRSKVDAKVSKQVLTKKEYEALSDADKAAYELHRMDKSVVGLAQLSNYGNERLRAEGDAYGKRPHITARNLEVLESHTMDGTLRKTISERLEAALGDKGVEIFEKYLGDKKDGDRIYGGVIDNLKTRGKYMAPGDDVVISTDKDGTRVIDDARFKELTNKGISEDEINRIEEAARRRGATEISEQYIIGTHERLSGAHAYNFNNGIGDRDLEEMRRRGFNIGEGKGVSINDIYMNKQLPDSFLNDSFYEQNLVIDMHLSGLAEDKQVYGSEDKRFLALPFSRSGRMQNGEFTQSKTQQAFKQFMNIYDEMMQLKESGEISDERFEKRWLALSNSYKEIVKTMNEEFTTKKTGLAKGAEYYLHDAGIYTTSGMQLRGDEQSKFLRDLSFEGISLLEQAAKMTRSKGTEGVNIAYAIGSQKAMTRLYNNQYFESLGLDEDTLNSFRENLKKTLNTSGTLSMHSRDPQGYPTSTNTNVMYFDDSVKGDTLLVSEALQNAKKNDNDSDKTPFSILKGKATIEQGGRVTRADIDYGTYMTLSKMGVKVSLDEATEKLFSDAKAGIFAEASTFNISYFNDRGVVSLADEERTSSMKHYKDFTVSGEYASERYGHVMGGWEDGEKAKFYSSKTYDATGRRQLEDNYVKMREDFRKTLSEDLRNKFDTEGETYQRGELIKHIENLNVSQTQRDEMADAVANHMLRFKEIEEVAANIRKKGAGEINYESYGFFEKARSAGYIGTEMHDISLFRTALDEAFLTPKAESGEPYLEFASDARRAFGLLYDAARTKRGIKEAQDEASQIFLNLLEGRRTKEFAHLDDVYDEAGNKIEGSLERAINTVVSFAERVDMSNAPDSSFKVGTRGGVKKGAPIYASGDNAINQEMRELNEISESMGNDKVFEEAQGPKMSEMAQRVAEQEKLDSEELVQLRRASSNAAASSMSLREAAGRGIAQIAQSLKGGGRAGNMLAGLIGGITLSGFASSPASPASHQANDAADYEDMYSDNRIPKLSDSNLYAMNSIKSGKSSYVVNISAKSQRGQQRAIDALNMAVANNIPQGSSVNINVRTSYEDQINQLQLSRMVANSLAM